MEFSMKYLTYKTISPQEFIKSSDWVESAGGGVLFFGTVRERTLQRRVTHLVYEAYASLADRMIDDLISKAVRIWPILGTKVLHRLGEVAVGEVAVAIEVVGEHRDEAYKASRFLIDQIKVEVPIWKKEYFEDGIYNWGRCDPPGPNNKRLSPWPLLKIKEPSLDRKDIKIFSPEKYSQMNREREYLNERMA